MQIPQEDTKVEDVIKKFKNPHKAADTIVILRDKGKVIVGQGYIRRIQSHRSRILTKQIDLDSIPRHVANVDLKS